MKIFSTGRNLNYTGRKRIPRECFEFEINRKDEHGDPELLIRHLDLQGLGLDNKCQVYLDARSRTFFHRKRLGTVARPTKQACPLPNSVLAPRIRFRLVVVESGAANSPIRASAENIRVRRPDEELVEGQEKALLPIKTANLEGLAWDVLWEEGRPFLAIHRMLPDPSGLVKNIGFTALVLPEALRRILTSLRTPEDDWEAENRKLWQEFAEALSSPCPPDDDEAEWSAWVDDAVRQFALKHDFSQAMKSELENKER